MAAGTRRFRITATRGSNARGFHFTFGAGAPQPGASAPARWFSRLVAIPIAIAALALGLFSLVFVLVVAVVAIAAFGIAWWWRRRKASRTGDGADALEGEYVVVEPAVPPKITAPMKEHTGSPQ